MLSFCSEDPQPLFLGHGRISPTSPSASPNHSQTCFQSAVLSLSWTLCCWSARSCHVSYDEINWKLIKDRHQNETACYDWGQQLKAISSEIRNAVKRALDHHHLLGPKFLGCRKYGNKGSRQLRQD